MSDDEGKGWRRDYPEHGYRDHDTGEHHAKFLKTMISHLDEFRDQTHPEDGDASAKSKDHKAFRSLMYAGKLFRALTGWAVDHQIGLALEERSFVPLGHPKMRHLPEHTEAMAQVNDHRHELRGAHVTTFRDLEPATQRRVLINILEAAPSVLPGDLAAIVVNGLKALDHGDDPPIFRPEKTGAKIGREEQQLQLKARRLVYYRIGRGKKKYRPL